MNNAFFKKLKEEKVSCRNLTCLTWLLRIFKANTQGKPPVKGRYKFENFSRTFRHSVIFDVRKTKEEKNSGFDRNKCYSYAAVGLAKNFWQGAMSDSAINWEVIVVANGCVYRKTVLNEKCYFILELKEAKVACRNLTCLTGLLRTFKAKLLREDP